MTIQVINIKGTYRPLRVRWALSLFKDVPLRTRRALLLYKIYGDSTLLVLNETSLNSDSALLALNWAILICININLHTIYHYYNNITIHRYNLNLYQDIKSKARNISWSKYCFHHDHFVKKTIIQLPMDLGFSSICISNIIHAPCYSYVGESHKPHSMIAF